jgi:2-keto-4-pentenoate hydratase/2-oxohepta-3-ene-1,7-dioic acid hydratase in catechol pathway
MRLVTFERVGHGPEPGVLLAEGVVGLGALGFPSMLDLIERWSVARPMIEQHALAAKAAAIPLPEAQLLAPIPRPRKLICVGLNYRDHAIESGMEIPKIPTIFNKFSTSVIGPGQAIVLPRNSSQPDYEAEFAFVVGTGGRYIRREDWASHVFGYTMVNDISARDIQLATSQWLMGKTFDTFAPMGPAIVTTDEISDPHSLNISLRITDASGNCQTFQNSNTRELIFKIPDLIEFLSSVFTLEPGDIVSTGTPSGVGFARKPPRYLQPGDDVVVSVERLGELRNPVIAATA